MLIQMLVRNNIFIHNMSMEKYGKNLLYTSFQFTVHLFSGFHFPSTASLVSARLISSEKSRVFGIVTAGSHVGTVVRTTFGIS